MPRPHPLRGTSTLRISTAGGARISLKACIQLLVASGEPAASMTEVLKLVEAGQGDFELQGRPTVSAR